MIFLIIDGNSILNRAYYAIKSLSDSRGQNINGVYGFVNILRKFINQLQPEYVAVAFDVSRKTFRADLCKTYKGTRAGTPDDLKRQMPVIQDLLELMGFAVLKCPGFEADDILGTLSHRCCSPSVECVLLTGDRDAYQLVKENVRVILPTIKNKTSVSESITLETIREKYGLEPLKLIDVKALAGDTSDNIPGCRGIGEKTAVNLISRFVSVENLFENLAQIESASLKNKLVACKEDVFLSKVLAEIRLDAPVNCSIDEYVPKRTSKKALTLKLAELGMKTAIQKINLLVPHLADQEDSLDSFEEPPVPIHFVTGVDEIEELKEIKSTSKLYVALDEQGNRLGINAGDNIYVLPLNENLKTLAAALEKFAGQIYFDDIKRFQTLLFKENFEESLTFLTLPFCITLAGYILDSLRKKYEVDRLVRIYLEPGDYINFSGDDFVFGLINSPRLCEILEQKLAENDQLALLKELEIPVAEVLVAMEQKGFLLDVHGLSDFGNHLEQETKMLEEEIFSEEAFLNNSVERFNLNSSQKLSHFLFETLKLPTQGRNKSGFKTDVESLEKISHLHPIIKLILKRRKLTKLKATYVDGLLTMVDSTNHVHTLFKQTETKTGRLSSAEPNLQNVPIRTELGKNLRKFFVAEPGCVLADADYSQIELRVLAEISQDETLINSFRSDEDVHRITASEIFDVPLGEVTAQMRMDAKTVNFGIIYGIGPVALAEGLSVSTVQAAQYIKSFFAKFPKVEEYLTQTVSFAEANGYVNTLFDRRIYIPELKSNNKSLISFGKRVAYNSPIQGSAADIIKLAMVNLQTRIKKEKLRSKIILQVHDEIIVQVPTDEQTQMEKILHEEMETFPKFKLPLKVDVGFGSSWFAAKS
ncbi:DNA polymerase [Clostridia bacterium]|nr:DNA polymerase [Clostridia bacterium]